MPSSSKFGKNRPKRPLPAVRRISPVMIFKQQLSRSTSLPEDIEEVRMTRRQIVDGTARERYIDSPHDVAKAITFLRGRVASANELLKAEFGKLGTKETLTKDELRLLESRGTKDRFRELRERVRADNNEIRAFAHLARILLQ